MTTFRRSRAPARRLGNLDEEMKQNYKKHAEEIVQYFQQQLSKKALKQIKKGDFDELTVMVESAISTSVLQATEQIAERLQELSKQLRKGVEHFES